MWPFDRQKTIDVSDLKTGKVKIMRHGKPVSVRGYDGAKVNRLTLDWLTGTGDANAEAAGDLGTLRKRSRDLLRNNDYAKGARTVIVDNVIGKAPGIQLSPRLKDSQGNLDRKLNEQIAQVWYRWGKSKYCHAARECSFPLLQRQVLEAVIEGGEVFVKKVYNEFSAVGVPVSLEILEAEYCPLELNTIAENGNRIIQGIEVNRFGTKVAYHLYKKHPGDTYNNDRTTVRIDARDVIHVKLPGRPGQVRGVPWMHATILRLRDMGGMEQATLTRARASAGVMGFAKSEHGAMPTDADGKAYLDADPGGIVVLGQDDSMEFWDPKFPDAAFETFMVMMLRGAAAGLGMSYETLARDHSKSNYSSTRVGQLNERIGFGVFQEWIAENLLAPVYEWFLQYAHVGGALMIPGYSPTTKDAIIDAAYWMPPGWDWVDPLKEITADAMAVESGFRTLQDIHAKRGSDFYDWLETTKGEIEALAALGIEHPMLAKQKTTVQVSANDEGDDADEKPKKDAVPFRVLRGNR
jgi:lambda family phage portal protein